MSCRFWACPLPVRPRVRGGSPGLFLNQNGRLTRRGSATPAVIQTSQHGFKPPALRLEIATVWVPIQNVAHTVQKTLPLEPMCCHSSLEAMPLRHARFLPAIDFLTAYSIISLDFLMAYS
jgi:hypothetical protein